MTPGSIIHYKGNLEPRFCPIIKDGTNKIDNNLYWEGRILVNNKQENCILLFVEPLGFSKKTAMGTCPEAMGMATATATAMAAGAATAAGSTATAMVTWDTAVKEFKETGKIQGGIFLTGNGKLIWISHYDLKGLLNDE